MDTATITQAKNGLSALIDRVRGGESILILDRGIPVARLEPVTTLADPAGRISRLTRSGIVRPAAGRPPIELIRTRGPALAEGSSAVAAIVDERATDR
jgi:prevent-host-death family protein